MPAPVPDPMRRNEHSRRAILDAALTIITERGYEGTSIEQIAERAGVGKQTIYRWWPSKGAVLLEALERFAIQLSPLPLQNTGNIVEDLRHEMQASIQLANTSDFGPAFRAVVAAAQSDPVLARANYEVFIEARSVQLRAMLTQAQNRGDIRTGVDLDTVIDMLFGVILYRMLLHTRPLKQEQVDAALDIVLQGLL